MRTIDHQELEFRLGELVSYLVRMNTNDSVELQNWLRLGPLIVVPDPASLGGEDVNQNWNILATPEGKFEKVAFYIRALPPKQAADILRKEVLPVLRGNLDSPEAYVRRTEIKESDSGEEQNPTRFKRRLYSLWAYPHDKNLEYLKSVEHKWEWGGFFLGPIWILIKGGPLLLALVVLTAAIVPFFIFGVNFITVIWAVIAWAPSAKCDAGLWAMRLKSLGHERVGEVSAISHKDAQDQYRKRVSA